MRPSPVSCSVGADVTMPAAGEVSVSLASPKSSTFSRPSLDTMMLPGLRIAVRDAALMRGRDRVGQRNGDLQELRQRQSTRRDQLVQRLTLDEFHRQKTRAFVFLDGVDGDDVRMGERGDGVPPIEAFAEGRIGESVAGSTFTATSRPRRGSRAR